jgi:hypothetical protein
MEPYINITEDSRHHSIEFRATQNPDPDAGGQPSTPAVTKPWEGLGSIFPKVCIPKEIVGR